MNRAGVIMVFASCAVLLAGCSEGGPDGELAVSVEAVLRPHEDVGVASVDFDSVVEGEWTRLAIVCHATDAAVAAALGFAWDQPKRNEVRDEFAYVFATDTHVEQFFGPITWAPFDDRTYVSPCNLENLDDVAVLVFERDDSEVHYLLAEDVAASPNMAWFLEPDQGTPIYGQRH